MKTTTLLSALVACLLPAIAEGALIQVAQVNTTNPNVNTATAAIFAETTAGGGAGTSITTTMTMGQMTSAPGNPNGTDAQNRAIYRYRVTGPDARAAADQQTAFSFNVTNNDPDLGVDPLPNGLFRDFSVNIANAYTSGLGTPVSFELPSIVTPAGWTLISSSATQLVWRFEDNRPAVIPGNPTTFAVDVFTQNPSAGNTFDLRLVARNPEPGSMALAGLAMTMVGGGAAAKRRKKKRAAKKA